MTKKEMDKIINDPVKFAKRYFPDIDIKEVYAMEKTIKELKGKMRGEARKNIIIDDPIDYSKFLKLMAVYELRGKYDDDIKKLHYKKEEKMKEKTVKKAVRDLIVNSYNISMRFLGESKEAPFGISSWQIQTAHPKHQLSGLRKLRELKEEFYRDCPYTAYIYRRNKYYMTVDFYQWLKEYYKN